MIETKFKQSEIGLIPEEWETISMSDLFEFGNGYTPSKENSAYWTNGSIPWYRVEDIREKGHVLTDSIQHVTMEAVKGKLFPNNSFIISTSASVGEYAYIKTPYLANQRFVCLMKKNIQKSDIDDVFFLSLCEPLGKWCKENCDQGSSFASVNMPSFRSHHIPLPPLAEQRRIAKALSDVDALISSLDKLIEKKKAIKQGAMQQLLTGKKRLKGFSEPWVEKRLGDVLSLRNGFAFKSETYSASRLYKIITIANVQNGRLDLTDYNSVTEIPDSIQRHQILSLGDILISMTGNIGRVCRVDSVNCLLNQRVGLLDVKLGVNPDFVFTALNTTVFENAMRDKGQGAAQANIGKSDIEDYLLMMPLNENEQTAIANILTKMDDDIAAIEQKRAKYIAIKQGMMQQLLTGKIRLI